MTNRRLTGVLLGVLVVCLVAGGVGAFLLGRQHAVQAANPAPATSGESSADPSDAPDTTASGSDGQQSSDITAPDPEDPGSGSAGDAAPEQPSDLPSPDGSDNDGPEPSTGDDRATDAEPTASFTEPQENGDADPGSREVVLADAAQGHPQSQEIRDIAQRYFDGINNRDFELWASAVSPREASAAPREKWLENYSTTVDTGMMIVRIDEDPVRARVSFVSHQDPGKSRNNSDCTRWEITLPVEELNSGELVLGPSIPDEAEYSDCAG